ncbi:MAG: leucyl aminopeptidase [Actinomycetota bacterium]|nr:leucyl aminopeptidase [Actinomycetota bacterium]
MTTYALRQGNPAKTRADVVVVGVARGKSEALEICTGGEPVAAAYGRRFATQLRSMGFTGVAGEVLRVPTAGTIKAAQLVVVGLGEREELTSETVRRAAGVAARNLGNAASVAVALPAADAEHVRAVADGMISGLYRFAGYKSEPSESAIAEVAILSDVARQADPSTALNTALVVGELADLARDWVNTPPNELTPPLFADAVLELTGRRKRSRVHAEVYDVEKLSELGCGGILGVGQGSAAPPRMVKLTWAPQSPQAHVALVGKGITYDSGGYSIKSGASMALMKNDMAGAAAVVAAIHAVAALKIPVAVTAYAPMAENMVSGAAYRPGDVLTMYDGQTVEVRNTDAEGRMILADALAMAAEDEPDAIVDIATLTGPCVVALGEKIAGLFGDDATVAAVDRAAAATGELVWRLPVPEETIERVRTESPIADVLQSNWARFGGASWAAAFLRQFTGGRPWAHLDIAGPAYNSGSAWGHTPAGATGFGIATLVQYVASLAG